MRRRLRLSFATKRAIYNESRRRGFSGKSDEMLELGVKAKQKWRLPLIPSRMMLRRILCNDYTIQQHSNSVLKNRKRKNTVFLHELDKSLGNWVLEMYYKNVFTSDEIINTKGKKLQL